MSDKALILLRTLPRVCLGNVTDPGSKKVNANYFICCLIINILSFCYNFRQRNVDELNMVVISMVQVIKDQGKGKITCE